MIRTTILFNFAFLRTTDGRPYGIGDVVGARIARPLLRRLLHGHLRRV